MRREWTRVGTAEALLAAVSLAAALAYEFSVRFPSDTFDHMLVTVAPQVTLNLGVALLLWTTQVSRARLILPALVANGLIGGLVLGPLGGLDGPFFYSSYVLPMFVMVTPSALAPRILTIVAMEAGFIGMFALTSPDGIAHPMIDIWVATMFMVLVVATYFGHVSYRRFEARFLAEDELRLAADRVAAENQSLRNELRRYADRVHAMARELEEAEAEARARIARDLHDDIAQVLTGARIQLEHIDERLDTTFDRGEAAEFFGLLGTLEEGVRSAISELRRRPDINAPPADRLQDLVETWSETVGVGVTFEGRYDRIPEGARELAYRVVQEGLTNVARHAASARDVAVSLGSRDGTPTVSVRNRSAGRRTVAVPGGGGLAGLRERAAELGGSLQFVPDDGDGFTTLTLELDAPDRTR